MTQRERQLLNWIEENPLISQQELADKAGITRSSVAVHISNLMKKGYITGKGYIVHTAPYVTVVGGVNMDIGGWPGEVLVMQDSNPGVVRMSLGGVGRNIAHNMSPAGHGRPAADGVRRRHQRPEDRRQLRRAGHRHLPVPDRCPEGTHLHLPLHHRRKGRHGPGRQRYGDLQAPDPRRCWPSGRRC